MRHKKQGFQAFGLTLIAALGLMAFMAVGAQANWLYLEGGAAKELTANEKVSVSQHKEGILLYEGNGGVTIEVKCATLEDKDLLLEPEKEVEKVKVVTASGKVAFSSCKTFSNGSAASECDPKNEPIEAGGSAKLILHNGVNYVLFSPPEGGAFAEIKFDPATCALTSTNKVKGNVVAECGLLKQVSPAKDEKTEGLLTGVGFVGNDCGEHMQWGLLQEASAALFSGDVLKFGNKVAKIDGIAKVELAGTHPGAPFGGTI